MAPRPTARLLARCAWRARSALALGVGLALLPPGCGPIGPFACTEDVACRRDGLVGTCEATQFCSYPDSECDSGRRYSEHAQSGLARECVDEVASGSSTVSPGSTGSSGLPATGSSTEETSETGGNPSCGNGMLDPDEECDDGNTEDGDGCSADCRPSGGILWEQLLDPSGGEDDVAYGLAVGPDGRLLLVGGTGPDASDQMLLALCAADGSRCDPWTRDGGTPGLTVARDAAFLSDGTFVVGGRDRQGTVPSTERAWYGRLDDTGATLWTGAFNLGPSDEIFGVGVDALGQVTVAGTTGDAAWIQRRSADGAPLWSDSYGEPGTVAEALVSGQAGDSVVVGSFDNGGSGLDLWMRRYDAAGAASPPVQISGAGASEDRGHGVAITPTGDIVVVGVSEGEGWIGRFGPDQTVPMWADTTGVPGRLWAVAATAGDDVVVVGVRDGDGGQQDGWVARYDLQGAARWQQALPSADMGANELTAVAIDDDGRLFVAGWQTVDGQLDVRLAELTP